MHAYVVWVTTEVMVVLGNPDTSVAEETRVATELIVLLEDDGAGEVLARGVPAVEILAGAVTVVVSVEQAEEVEEDAELDTRLRVPAVEMQLAPG